MSSSPVDHVHASATPLKETAARVAGQTGLLNVKRVFRDAGRFEARHRAQALHRWFTGEAPINSTESSFDALQKRTDVVATVSIVPEAKTTFTPNDPLYPEQSHYAALNMEAAWELNTGSPQVIVAIIDTGADLQNPDLARCMRSLR
eukprot:6196135-Pleurochrysis_carterae.AAC.2